MKRIASSLALLLAACTAALAQQGGGQPADPNQTALEAPLASLPLTYIGGNSRISIGIDEDGNSQGDALHVFQSDGDDALIGQLWWQDGGAGGLEVDYNWLLGISAAELRAQPRKATVAKLSFAIDQNASNDRKATLGFGLERNDYFINSYLSTAASGGRLTGNLIEQQVDTLNGTDAIGRFTEEQTTTEITPIQTRPYRGGLGFRFGHFSNAWTLRATAGLDYAYGAQGAEEWRGSLALEKYLGKRGWSLAAQAEHSETSSAFGAHHSDDRITVLLRYEFGGRGAFVAGDQLPGPAAVTRALRTPSSSHPRAVQVYQSRRGEPTRTTTLGPRQYLDRSPIAVDDSAVVAADSGGTAIAVLANDRDPEGQPLRLTAVGNPAHGSTAIVGDQALYTPAAGFVGADSFSYTVSDPGGLTATGTVAVSVQATASNRAPIARDDSVSTAADSAVSIDVLANDSDLDGDPLRLSAVTPPLSGGSVEITPDQRIRYSPAAGFSGNDQFGYSISDGRGGVASANVNVSVIAGNRPPLAVDDNASTSQGSVVSIDVLANDSDPDGDPISLVSASPAAFGSAVPNADGSIRYTPGPGFTGIDSLIYTITDGRGGFASANVSILVTAVNAPPLAQDDSASTDIDVPVTIAVLANDADPDGDPLVVQSAGPAGFGTVVRNADNTVTYTPNARFVGTDAFDYTISDGQGGFDSGRVIVTVRGPNNPPIAVDDFASTGSGAAVTISVLANDADPDGDPLSVQSVTVPAGGSVTINPDNTLTYTPSPTFGGSDRFTYTISDGRGGQASALVVVAVNRAPVAQDDSFSVIVGQPNVLNVLANDADPDGDPLSVIAVSTPGFGSAQINPDNSITYTAGPNFPNADIFVYTISDGRGGVVSATVSVFVPIP